MATIGRFYIDGKLTNPPTEAVPEFGQQGIVVEAFFGSDNVQPVITPQEFTFTNEAAKIIRDYVDAGNIYDGLPFAVELVGQAGTISLIDGFLDLVEKYDVISPVQVVTTAKYIASTDNVDQQMANITLDLMDAIGVLTQADYPDIPYVVEKTRSPAEIAITSITLFLMLKELAENVEKLAEDVATVLGMTGTSATGGIGATIYQIAVVILRAAYIAILIKAIIDLIEDLLENFISPIRNHKGLTLRTGLEKTFNHLGYEFESPLKELDFYTYIPSAPSNGQPIQKGIPRSNDYGYNFAEFVELAKSLLNARIAVLDGVLHFRTESDPFWQKNSTYKMPDILLEDNSPKQTNADELVKGRIIQFTLDTKDDWTYDNRIGTQLTIITQSDTGKPQNLNSMEGYEQTIYPVALGNVKEELNDIEIALRTAATAADTVLGFFGSNKRLADRVEKRVGMLKVSDEIHSVPKMIYQSNGVIPLNHRDLLSARYSYENYLIWKFSFVAEDFRRQRDKYDEVLTGFGMNNFIETIINS